MQLILRAVRTPPGSPVSSASFGAGGGTIGRNPGSTLVLPDPRRYISRAHVEVRCISGGFSFKVLSKVNPIVVNGQTVNPNEAVGVKEGDVVVLGDYEFIAALSEGEPPPQPAVASVDPFAFLTGSRQGSVSGDDTQRASFPDLNQADITSRHAQPATHNSDPLLDLLGASSPSALPATSATLDSTRSLSVDSVDEASAVNRFLSQGGGVPDFSGRDSMQKMGGLGMHSDHVQDFNLPFQPPRAVSPVPASTTPSSVDDDIFSSLFAPQPGTVSEAPNVTDLLSQFDGLSVPAAHGVPAAKALVTPAPVAQGYSAEPSTESAGGVALASLLASFAQGLNLAELKVPPEQAEAFMHDLGALLRQSVEGIYDLLILRAEVKKELRADERTMIASRENNPLKHTESVEEALKYLLDFRQANPAFLPPVRAMHDAFNDVRAHEIAVMAGMRAALSGVLKRFDPKVLENRIKKGGALDSVLPALYKAKLWESYLDMYGEIESEAEDHFDKSFGREFVKAYTLQCKRLRKQI